MNASDNRESTANAEIRPIANMSRLDFLMLLWEARIIGKDYVDANT